MSFFQDKRVVGTEVAGFMGSYMVKNPQEKGSREIFVPRKVEYDLRRYNDLGRMYRDAKPRRGF